MAMMECDKCGQPYGFGCICGERNKPKPCPFCGGTDIDIRKRKTVIIECNRCSAMFIQMTTEGAIAAWNRRA